MKKVRPWIRWMVGLVAATFAVMYWQYFLGAIGVCIYLLILLFPIVLAFLTGILVRKRSRILQVCLIVAGLIAVMILSRGPKDRPLFGNDVAGNMNRTAYNFKWAWGVGWPCVSAGAILGALLMVGARALNRKT